MTSEPLLVADRLQRAYGPVRAIKELSLAVRPGEIYGLVGSDGAGKTTAMRLFAGLIAATGGAVRVLGRDPLRATSQQRALVGYMPQHYSLYGDLTVDENLRFFSRLHCQSRAEYAERRARLLRITRLEAFGTRRADALSGGMYKKLALACSLLPRPKLLLLDEPTNGIDPVSRRELWALLFELVRDEMAVLISTAYMDEAARCHRVGLMHRGELLLEGMPAELLGSFSDEVFELRGEDHERGEALIAEHPAVVARAATGARLRVVVRKGMGSALARALAEHGLELVAVSPSFEDLFLAVTARPQAHA